MIESHERPLSRVELLVLGRLSGARGATTTELATSLHAIGLQLAKPAMADCVTATLASLDARALVARSAKPSAKPRKLTRPRKTTRPPPGPRFTLTETGGVALRDALGVKATPSWKEMCDCIVPALALGVQPGSEAADRALASAEAMIAGLLQRDRALGEVSTAVQLCDRIIARALGMPPGPVTSNGIRAYALAMHCGAGTKTELADIAARFAPAKGAKAAERELKVLATRLADKQLRVATKTKATIVKSLQRRWVSKQDEADDAQRPSTLRSASLQPPRPEAHETPSPGSRSSPSADSALLLAVRDAIPMVGSDGRYGKENVFVSALWRQVARDRRLPALSLDGFKRWLVTANRNQLLALARADLVDDMDVSLIMDSEIEDLGATFHFVLDRREPPFASGQVHDGR